MACLTNYILVDGHCEGETPTSGLYINKALPGITLKQSANLAEGEIQTGVQLLNQAIENGIQSARAALVSEMLGVVRFNTIASTGVYGAFPPDTSNADYLPLSYENRGLKFELNDCCRLSSLHIKKVEVLVTNTITNNGMVMTIVDGETVTEYAFNTASKTVATVYTNYKAQNKMIKVLLSHPRIVVADTDINCSGNCGFCSNGCTGRHDCGCTTNLTVTGYNETTGQTSGGSFGLSVTADVICDEEKFFCELSTIPDVAWLTVYQAGIWFFEYLLTTNRINVYTLYNKETISARIEQWNQKSQEITKKLVKQLPKYLATIDDCCVECNSSQWKIQIP